MLSAMRGPTSSTFCNSSTLGLFEGFHRSEVLGQKLRGALADHADAQAVDHALQRQLLRVFDFVENVLRRLVAHALQAEQIVFGELVDVGDVLHQAAFGELRDQRVAHAVNIHDAARGEVQDGSEQFGRDSWH